MKATDWKKAIRPVLPPEQAWGFRGTLCYRQPVEWVVTGVFGEGSAYTEDMYVYRFVLPLFRPSEHITLTWSERVGRGQVYGPSDLEAFQSVVRSGLASLGSEQEELARIASAADTPNHRIIEDRGYALILLGDKQRALSSLRTVAAGGPVRQRPQQKMINRAQYMCQLLHHDGLAAATEQLARWRDETCAALGLQRQPDSPRV
jgi:hypothetical protein